MARHSGIFKYFDAAFEAIRHARDLNTTCQSSCFSAPSAREDAISSCSSDRVDANYGRQIFTMSFSFAIGTPSIAHQRSFSHRSLSSGQPEARCLHFIAEYYAHDTAPPADRCRAATLYNTARERSYTPACRASHASRIRQNGLRPSLTT